MICGYFASCISFVWLSEHCVGHLMPAQCFLVFSTPRGVEHTPRRFTMKTCAFTGHRPKSVDMYAAEIVLALKEKYPQITLECAIPYERQAVRWPEALRNRYFSIAERCDKETMLQTHYTQDCLGKRNQYMVDHADIVLAVCNMRLHSGSRQTVLMARRRLKPVWLIFPDTLELSVI